MVTVLDIFYAGNSKKVLAWLGRSSVAGYHAPQMVRCIGGKFILGLESHFIVILTTFLDYRDIRRSERV